MRIVIETKDQSESDEVFHAGNSVRLIATMIHNGYTSGHVDAENHWSITEASHEMTEDLRATVRLALEGGSYDVISGALFEVAEAFGIRPS